MDARLPGSKQGHQFCRCIVEARGKRKAGQEEQNFEIRKLVIAGQ